MDRETLFSCVFFVSVLAALLICLSVLLHCRRRRLVLAQIHRLHRDQRGAVQSLSFVLTLPLLLMIIMFIVQLALITMARISVEYAAFAAARSATVWFPANLGTQWLAENRVSLSPLVPVRVYESDGRNYTVYRITPDGDKLARIHLAAAMACMPISPSTNTAGVADHPGNAALPAIQHAYQVLAPGSRSNGRIPARLRNKLAYALANTEVEIEIHHCSDQIEGGDPPLYPELSLAADYPTRYLHPNEIGWQDQIYVTVHHQYALLPGPGRLLARRADSPRGPDQVAEQIEVTNGVYTRTLTATTRIGNEGQKPTPTIHQGNSLRPTSYVQPVPWVLGQ